jgi:hypothetical protein
MEEMGLIEERMPRSLFDAIDDIIEIIRFSSDSRPDPWAEIVNHCEPIGIIDDKYCKPVEQAVEKYLSRIREKDKRNIWLDTEAGQMEQDEIENIPIESIEMDLGVELFSEVMRQAFSEAEFNRNQGDHEWF